MSVLVVNTIHNIHHFKLLPLLPLLLPFCRHCKGQPVLAGTSSQELKDFVGVKYNCPNALLAAYSDYGEDARVLLNDVTCTVSIPFITSN